MMTEEEKQTKPPIRDNYFCCEKDCNYWTKAKEGTAPEELDEILEKDGGWMKDKRSSCPKCKKDSLVYVY